VRGIARLLREALVNYVTNAIKYSGEGRTIVVRVRSQDAAIRIEVQDDGPGIPPEAQTRLFQEFVRVSKARMRKRARVWAFPSSAASRGPRGEVGVESTPGHGSCFFLTLPVFKSAGQEDA